VLEHLGLAVTRLIRVSFGPFQLGDLERGAVREVPRKVLRDQLGPRLVEAAGAEFPNLATTTKRAANTARPANEPPAPRPVRAPRPRRAGADRRR
jgi:23S rRNA pseudouridine2605 synthase